MLKTNRIRYRHEHKLGIPVTWLNDGIIDCISGEDESNVLWPTCKLTRNSLRHVVNNASCTNVFLCKPGSLDYIELDMLCDGREDCGEEMSVCLSSRQTSQPFVAPVQLRSNRFILYCLPGLHSVEQLTEPCVKETFHSPDYPVFGVKLPTLSVPNITINCDNVHGEIYVFLSCTGRCVNSSCNLSPLRHDSCPEDANKAFSLLQNKYITVVKKHRQEYHNRLFLCRNNMCLTYDRVCNLVDDCGDGSDEIMCTNSFKCRTSELYIPLSKKCDGQIDCMDYTDECNNECNKEIIGGIFFKGIAWIIGGIAVFINVFSLWKGFFDPWSKSKVALINRTFKILISVGDFMTGIYLLLIAIVDLRLGREDYCKKQLSWLTSDFCATLGVINSIGSNLSLFSMTFLSIFRVMSINVWIIELKHRTHKFGAIVSLIVITSVMIACFPITSLFEDFFVNGMAYNDMTLFIGPADKKRHLDVLRSYYGKMSQRVVSWKDIKKLLDIMFSDDYGKISRRKIHFYGNEGVCLFKYFVKSDDPQKIYVWITLLINFTSFLIISGCYILLNLKARKTDRGVRKMMANFSKTKTIYSGRGIERLQQNITRIIVTDFVCWVPFLFICVLHSTGTIDATFLYPVSSIVILPINSIINPMIYNSFMVKWLGEIKTYLRLIWNASPPVINLDISETNPVVTTISMTVL